MTKDAKIKISVSGYKMDSACVENFDEENIVEAEMNPSYVQGREKSIPSMIHISTRQND